MNITYRVTPDGNILNTPGECQSRLIKINRRQKARISLTSTNYRNMQMPPLRFPIMVQLAVLAVIWCSPTNGGAQTMDSEKPKAVAIVIFDGVELLDFAGPAEVFIVANQRRKFRVFTVAPTTELTKTMGGIKIKPDYSFANAPLADVIVIPGGNTRAVKAEGIRWIRTSAKSAEIVMSVCFGAFLLAEAKLLDGVTATTHTWGIAGLKAAAPKCKVVSGRRFVDSGKIVTTAGVTAGIDGAVHVVERLAGKKVAQWTAESWMEHRTSRAANQSSQLRSGDK